MKQLLTTTLLLLLALPMAAQTQEKQITVTENVAYRTDVGPSTVLDVAQPLFGPQTNRPAILIIHGGGWSAGSKNDMVYRTLMVDYAMKGSHCHFFRRSAATPTPWSCKPARRVATTEEREQMLTRLIRGIKDGSIEVKVSKDNDKS